VEISSITSDYSFKRVDNVTVGFFIKVIYYPRAEGVGGAEPQQISEHARLRSSAGEDIWQNFF